MTTLSGSALPYVRGFDDYVSKAAAHDQSRPGGASARVEYESTLGDCRPESFVGDVLRTRLAYGKTDLEIDAYSYVLSHSHEELDPADDSLGAVAHGLARGWAREAWPGRQVKIVTQRDNGRWEEDPAGERVWVDGHWHSHIVVANVAEQPVELTWTDADGIEKVKEYKPGRAIDGDLKNIFRLRRVTDAVVLREWRYDNAAYVEACRQFSEGAASKRDLAQRETRGYSTYDEVRAKLRTAAAQATSWDDYVAHCRAAAVDVATRGASGVSYAWVDDDGLARKARARGKNGIGPEFTRAEVEKQCEANAQAVARGETLEVPDAVLVVPTSTVAPDRPRPVYLTADGKPPWEAEDALAAYEARVRSTGGTYEGRVAQALVTGEPIEGVTLEHRSDTEVIATVDAGDGPLRGDVDPALARRVAEVRRAEAELVERADELEELARETADHEERVDHKASITDQRAAQVSESWGEINTARRALEAERDALPQLREAAVAEGHAQGYEKGLAEGAAADRAAWKRTEKPRLIEETERTVRQKVEQETEADRQAAADDRQAAAEARQQADTDRAAAARRLADLTSVTRENATDLWNHSLLETLEAMPMRVKNKTTGEMEKKSALEVAESLTAKGFPDAVDSVTRGERKIHGQTALREASRFLRASDERAQAQFRGQEGGRSLGD